MTSIKCVLTLLACFIALAVAAPWGHKKHEHVVIHVPYHVHTVHHHHTKKIHIPVVHKEYIHVHDHHDHHHDHHEHLDHHEIPHFHGGWW